MAVISSNARNYLDAAIGDPTASREIAAGVMVPQSLTVTATAGSLPAPNKVVVIADTATPTVVELLEYCHELRNALKNAGLVL